MLEFLPDEIKNIVSDELIDLCEVRLRAGTKLVAEYKLDSSEVETMKKFATKYSLLKDEHLVDEYLGK